MRSHGGHGLLKSLALQLVVPPGRLIRRGEVREDAVAGKPAMEVDLAAKLDDLRIVHADAVHTRLDRHVVPAHQATLHRALTIGHGELGGVHGRHDAMVEQLVDRGNRRLGKDEDGRVDAALAQLDALMYRGNREHIGPGSTHHPGTLHRAVSVSVGLHYTAQALPGTKQVFESPRIAPQRVLIDFHPGPARARLLDHRHDYSSSEPASRPRSSRASSSTIWSAAPIISMRSVAITLLSPMAAAAA